MKEIQCIKQKFERSTLSYNRSAVAQKQIAQRLFQQIQHHMNTPQKRILEIGCGTGFLTQFIAQLNPSIYYLNDLNEQLEEVLQPQLKGLCYQIILGDAEQIEFPTQLDSVVSSSCVQWFRDLPRFLEQIANHICPGGHLFFSTFGPRNLQEIRAITQSGLPYFNTTELSALVPPNFELLFMEEEDIVLPFKSALDVLHHLKETGVNGGCRSRWTKSTLAAFCYQYEEQFKQQNNVPLTYHPIYIGLRKRE